MPRAFLETRFHAGSNLSDFNFEVGPPTELYGGARAYPANAKTQRSEELFDLLLCKSDGFLPGKVMAISGTKQALGISTEEIPGVFGTP